MSELICNLTNSQLKAITSDSKYILCFAAAGSGKTTVLTQRIAHLHKTQRIGGGNMLCLTFTRNAGKEMKERIIKLMGEREGKKVFCNTFHAFCITILKEWGYKIGYAKNFTIYDEEDKTSILKNILCELKIINQNEDIRKKDWDYLNECLEHPEYKKEDYPGLRNYILAVNEYKYKLKKYSAVDLDMLLTDTLKILNTNQDVREYYHTLYEYVFIDEFQDTNAIQMAIIKKINPQNLCIVGDDDQCIYEWRGAMPSYIINFKKEYPECEIIKLEDNFRSSISIVNAANNVIQNNKLRANKKMKSEKTGDKIEFIVADNAVEEADIIAALITGYENTSFKDFAILSRTNVQLDIIANEFKKFDIPYQIINNKEDILKKQDIKKILKFIEVAVNNKDDVTVKQILNFPYRRLTAEQISKVELKCIENEKSFYEGLISLKFKEQNIINDFISIFDKINSYILTENSSIKVFQFTTDLLNIHSIYNSQERNSKREDIKKAEEKINKWCEKKETLGEPFDILEFLKWNKSKDIQEKLIEEKDAVKLMTVHASKGLEFSTVFIIGMNQETFPGKKSPIEESRRLFYVALTRAKNNLFISRPKNISYKGGFNVETIESQFISEMKEGA